MIKICSNLSEKKKRYQRKDVRKTCEPIPEIYNAVSEDNSSALVRGTYVWPLKKQLLYT